MTSTTKTIITITVVALAAVASYHLVRLARADVQAAFGESAAKSDDHAEAAARYRRAILINPTEPSYYQAYADAVLTMAQGETDPIVTPALLAETVRSLETASDLNPLEGTAWLHLANTLWWLSGFPGHEAGVRLVEPYFHRALDTDPRNGMFLFGIVQYYLRSGQTDAARSYVARLAAAYPAAYGYLKDWPQFASVREEFRTGLLTASRNLLTDREALGLLAAMSAQDEDWPKAAAFIEEKIAKAEYLAKSHDFLNLGAYYLKAGVPAKARQAYVRGVTMAQDPLAALNSALWVFQKQSALDLFISVAETAAGENYHIRKNLNLLKGKAFFHAENDQAAKTALEASLKQKETAEAQAYLARIAIKQKDWDTAELTAQRASVLEPDNQEYHRLFAVALQRQNKTKSALEAIQAAIAAADKPAAHLYYTKGQLHWGDQQYQAAIQAWKIGAEIDPKNVGYPYHIAKAYQQLNELTEAETYLVAACNLKPDDQNLKNELAKLQQQKAEAAP